MVTVDQAMAYLRLDELDTDTREIVSDLLIAVPSYIEVATGLTPEEQALLPLCDTVTKFLIKLWYYPESDDADRLQRCIDSLLKSLKHMKDHG